MGLPSGHFQLRTRRSKYEREAGDLFLDDLYMIEIFGLIASIVQ